MRSDLPPAIPRRANHTVGRIFAAFPVACFTCALFTDIAYVQTTRIMWADFSDWLLAVGMAGGVIAAIVGLISLFVNRHREAGRSVWPSVIGSLLVLVIAFFNNLVHSRDAWTSVMPTGLALSAVTVLLMLATAIAASRASVSQPVVLPYRGVQS